MLFCIRGQGIQQHLARKGHTRVAQGRFKRCVMEMRLRAFGALFTGNAGNFKPNAVRDGNLVTVQNPSAGAAVADLMLQALFEKIR